MCQGDDRSCPQFDLHREQLLADLDHERRSFLKSAFVATGGAAALTAGGAVLSPAMGQTASARQGRPSHHYLPATADTVHWGYFSKLLKPQVEVELRRLHHHRDADPSCQRRCRAHGQGRSRRGERLPLDQGEKGRRPARRRSDGRQAARTRGGRGPRRAYLHRPGLRARRRARRHARSAHHRREAAAVAPIRNTPARHSAATRPPGGASTTRNCSPSPSRARSSRSTKSTPPASATGRRRSTISDGRRRPIPTALCTRPSTILASRSITRPSRRTTAS